MASLTVFMDEPELAVECGLWSDRLQLRDVEPVASAEPVQACLQHLRAGGRGALLISSAPDAPTLFRLAQARKTGFPLVLAMVGADPERSRLAGELASDLGIAAVVEVGPAMALVALHQAEAGAEAARSATRGLSGLDRARLNAHTAPGSTARGKILRGNHGLLTWSKKGSAEAPIGEPRDVATALQALHSAARTERPPMPTVEGLQPQAVLDVIYGPARALSDPASKSALMPYDVPLPEEELCASPSRAAAEAARLGFPVRIALASPDLRIWDHPDLCVDRVDNAARVKELYRQLVALAHSRSADARVLGVTVTAAFPEKCLLFVRAEPLPESAVRLDLGFADPHGAAAADRTTTVLPLPTERLEHVIRRLKGRALLLDVDAHVTLPSLHDGLLRVGAFVHEWREHIQSVQIAPLAVLVGGGLEAREACITVGAAFERSLQTGTG